MKPTDSFAPWMGKRFHMPTIPAGLFFTRQEHFDDSVEKAQGEWVQDEPPFDEAPTTPIPEPLSEESHMSTHPITGEQVPTVPVKRSNYKKTAPGTKPKRKKR